MAEHLHSGLVNTIPGKSSRTRILITGGAGFIGSHTADALVKAGYRVRILDNLDPQVHGSAGLFPSYLPTEVECIRGDVCEKHDLQKALAGVSAVFHFAALTGVGQSMYDLKHYTDVNVSGTACLLETILKEKFPVHKLILASSRAVYGEGSSQCSSCGIVYPSIRRRVDLEKGRFVVFCPSCGREVASIPTREDRPLNPVSIYGWTKKLQEELFQYASDTFGMQSVILRYFNVYGSRQSLINPYTGVISIFFSRMTAGKPISIYEGGAPRRDFVHIRDVVQANLKVLESELPGRTVMNVGSGQSVSIENVGSVLADLLGIQASFIDKGEFRIGDIHSCIADLDRSRQLVGFQPVVDLKEGLLEFVHWAKENVSNDLYDQAVKDLGIQGLFGQAGTGKDRG